jgi:hypothetical protein
LLDHPGRCRVCGNVQVEHLPPIVLDDEQDVPGGRSPSGR